MSSRPSPPANSWRAFLVSQFATLVYLALGAMVVLFLSRYFQQTSDQPLEAFAIVEPTIAPTESAQLVVTGLDVALIAGHHESDVGAMCDDGLTEAAINLDIARRVAARLEDAGYTTEIFAEFDGRISVFGGRALVSIHADSCGEYGADATGFKISQASDAESGRLKACLFEAYAARTGLRYHANTITEHMADYHAFREIRPDVPAVIIETGFMNLDRELLTVQSDIPADGIAAGILCYLERQS